MGKHKKKKRRRNRKMKRRKTHHKKSKGFSSYVRLLAHSRANEMCQFPNCENRGMEVHHIQVRSICINEYGWSVAKANSLDNAILLCRFHHRYVHKFERWKEYLYMFKTILYNSTYN